MQRQTRKLLALAVVTTIQRAALADDYVVNSDLHINGTTAEFERFIDDPASPGSLTIENAGHLITGDSFQSTDLGNSDTPFPIVIDGPGSTFETGPLYVGDAGSASLTVKNGGSVIGKQFATFADQLGSSAQILITGPGSSFILPPQGSYDAALALGAGGAASLTINEGGRVEVGALNMAQYSYPLSARIPSMRTTPTSSAYVSVSAVGSLLKAGSVDAGSNGPVSVNVSAGASMQADSLHLAGPVDHSQSINVAGQGSYFSCPDMNLHGQSSLSIDDSASADIGYVALDSGTTLEVGQSSVVTAGLIVGHGKVLVLGLLRLSPGSTSERASDVSALTITPTGRIDLANDPLLIDNTFPLFTIRSYLFTGQLFSSFATPTSILGYADAFDPFDSSIPLDAIKLVLTVPGDANLDGVVDERDAAIILANFDNGLAANHFWYQGDFNYDGRIDSQDIAIYNRFTSAATIPEPASALLIIPLLFFPRPKSRRS